MGSGDTYSGKQFVESGPKTLHIWDLQHAVSTWKICIIFNLMGEFKLTVFLFRFVS